MEPRFVTGSRLHRGRQSGAVLLVVLLFVFLTTLVSASLVQSYQAAAQREKEQQLIFAGQQYRRAIASYYATVPPGGARSFPASLEDLLNDNRFPTPMHHLRRPYPDPITGKMDWQLVREGDRIVAIHSTSAGEPLKKTGFPKALAHFENAASYSDWVFRVAR